VSVRRIGIGLLALGLASCSVPPMTSTGPPAPRTPRDTTSVAHRPAAQPPAPTHAAVDSTPSPEALAVLSTIPEPVPPSEQVPPPATPPAATAPVTSPPAARAAPGAPKTQAGCWRVQLVAPKDKPTAVKKRAAAESLLLLPVVIERESALWKVRTTACFDRATADRIKARAVASGFAGAFLFEKKP